MNKFLPNVLRSTYRYGIPAYLGAVPGLIQMVRSKDKEGWNKGKKNLKRGLLLGGAVSSGFIGQDLIQAYKKNQPPTVYKDGVSGLLKGAAMSDEAKKNIRLGYDILPLVAASLPIGKTIGNHLGTYIGNKLTGKKKGISPIEKQKLKREYLSSIFLKAPFAYGASKLMYRGVSSQGGFHEPSDKAKTIGTSIGAALGGGYGYWKNKNKKPKEKIVGSLLGAGVGGYLGHISTPGYILMAKGLKTFK